MKRRAFPGHGPDVDAKYLEAGHWLKAAIFGNEKSREWCKQKGILHKAAGEGINSAGGFLVPAALANAIFDIREEYGAFRRRARIVPMSTDELSVTRHTGGSSGTTAYFIGENTAATATQAVMDKINLVAKKIGSLIPVSNEVAEDSLPGIVDFLANEIGYAFASKEDDCAFNGDGTSTYGGMRGITQLVLDGNHSQAKVTAASGHNTFLLLDATDIGNLISQVRASAIPNAAWYISQTGFAQTFCRLAGAAGGAYLYTGMVDGIATPFYLGFPVVLCQKLPLISTSLTGKAMLAFGDMYAAGALGERRSITLARSPHRYFDSDEIAILGTERFDAVIHDLGDNTNLGSLAVLVAP